MTIFGLYAQNGNRAGFWIQHRTWTNMCARVVSIGGRESGALPGCRPLHDGATAEISCFDIRSGRPVPSAGAGLDDPSDRNFVPIAEPAWSHRAAQKALGLWRETKRIDDQQVAR